MKRAAGGPCVTSPKKRGHGPTRAARIVRSKDKSGPVACVRWRSSRSRPWMQNATPAGGRTNVTRRATSSGFGYRAFLLSAGSLTEVSNPVLETESAIFLGSVLAGS